MSSQPKQTIYLETSVISAYFDFWERSPEQKQATQEFWKKILPKFTPIISNITIRELENSKTEWREHYLTIIKNIKNIIYAQQAAKLAEKYVAQGIIPSSKTDDGSHLAISVINHIDFFVTWNMKHFLRPYKLKQIADFNKKFKLHLPVLVKPIDFLE